MSKLSREQLREKEANRPINTATINNKFSKTDVVFRMKPNPFSNVCYIKNVGYINDQQTLGDEVIEIETSPELQQIFGKNTFYYGEIEKYDITINAYKTNMTGSFVVKNKVYPVYSLSFMYKKSIVVGYLFDIYLSFDLDLESICKLKNYPDYVNARVSGTFNIRLECDKELYELFDTIDNRIDNYIIEDLKEENIDINNLTDEQITTMLNMRREEKKQFYRKLINGYNVEFTTPKRVINEYLFPFMTNKHMKCLISLALEMRRQKRAKSYGAFEGEYTEPTNVIKLNDISTVNSNNFGDNLSDNEDI